MRQEMRCGKARDHLEKDGVETGGHVGGGRGTADVCVRLFVSSFGWDRGMDWLTRKDETRMVVNQSS